MMAQILFALALALGTALFVGRVRFIRRNILLGRDLDLSDNPAARWKQMALVAMGQSKMVTRPLAGFMHILIYLGFVLINIEVLEILVDGLAGTHRVLSFLGPVYNLAIGFFEWLALGVLLACVVFLVRRLAGAVPRLNMAELKGWPQKDALIILLVEIVLMSALLLMNASDKTLQERGHEHYISEAGALHLECPDCTPVEAAGYLGSFPISQYLQPLVSDLSEDALVGLERGAWWFHFLGILAFLNYVPYSKHWHIIMAFPNTYYTPLKPKGDFGNMASVTTEIQLMMDPSATPPEGYEAPTGFGAKDVYDLSWKNLMDAYTCTECGRCSSVCPANLTGKKLSPRKVMMDTRDRLEEVGHGLDAAKKAGQAIEGRLDDGKSLHDRITAEELWACTTCNACAEACPVNINPVDIIVQMRQYKVMEESAAPSELNNMFTNMENNGAPWQFNQMAKADWTKA
ncbi:MAG: 4Fe-4S dicluster domain-containing protein [Bacteroidia bacterium]